MTRIPPEVGPMSLAQTADARTAIMEPGTQTARGTDGGPSPGQSAALQIRTASTDRCTLQADNVSKCFCVYDRPMDRLWDTLWPRKHGPPRGREFWALKNISLRMQPGETLGLVGRNGSGKSTLLQIICGTLRPTAGNVHAAGRVAALLELGAGFNPEFTGKENVFLYASVLGMSRAEIADCYGRIVEFSELAPFMDQPVKTYSSGMFVRLAFSVATSVAPQILVVDEALAVGDEPFQRKCFARIRALKEFGTTILFVSHSAQAVVELCDRALLLDQGEQITAGVPKEVVSRYMRLANAAPDVYPLVRAELLQEAQTAAQTEECGPGRGSNSGPIVAAVCNSATAATSKAATTPEVREARRNDLGTSAPPKDESPSPGGSPLSPTLGRWDPHLQPTSTMVYEPRGAMISGVRITTATGEPVNLLHRGERYLYRYQVKFADQAAAVRFGMLIKTTSGLELGGATTHAHHEPMADYRAGTEVEICFSFRCLLYPATYFLNAGVEGEHATKRLFLHRIVDAAMFRVLPEAALTQTGLIDFEIQSRIQPCGPPLHEKAAAAKAA